MTVGTVTVSTMAENRGDDLRIAHGILRVTPAVKVLVVCLGGTLSVALGFAAVLIGIALILLLVVVWTFAHRIDRAAS